MALNLPKDPKKIRERIKRYERSLQKEHKETGWYRDGSGKRYLLGPLYLLMNDLEGAIASFKWYEKTFPDDVGEVGHSLCWTLALYRNRETEAARKKLRQTMLKNLFIVPHLLDMNIEGTELEAVREQEDSSYAGWGFSGEESFYINEIPGEYVALWNAQEKQWVLQLYQSQEFKNGRTRLIAIQRELNGLAPGPRRSELVEEEIRLKHT